MAPLLHRAAITSCATVQRAMTQRATRPVTLATLTRDPFKIAQGERAIK